MITIPIESLNNVKNPNAYIGSLGPFFYECYDFLQEYVPFDGDNLFVAGGFFARRFLGRDLRDIDVFVNGDEAYYQDLLDEYRRLGFELCISDGSSGPSAGCFRASKNDLPFDIDLIHFHKPKTHYYIKSFDFDICQIAMSDGFLYLDDATDINSLRRGMMRFTGYCHQKTMARAFKYAKLGYDLSQEDIQAIAFCYMRNDFYKNADDDVPF